MPRKISGREAHHLRILRTRANKQQGGLCYWCKQPMKEDADDGDPLMLTADHLVPMHAGGQTRPGNIVAACRKCNNERHPELRSMGGGLVASTGEAADLGPWAPLMALKTASGG